MEVVNSAPENNGELEVSVTANTRELAQPGEITFNFLLRNTGTMDVSGVTISDREGNVLEQVDTLQPGDKLLPVAVRVEESGSMTEELSDNTVTHLGEIKKAMEKQYDSLFDNDKLDLSVDMEALTLACKRDGLLEDENGEEK